MQNDTLSQLRAGSLAGITRLDLSCELHDFPEEIFGLADSLEILNLSGNRLRTLPADLHRLHKLRAIFCSDNLFTELPSALGDCPALDMVGFKANRISQVAPNALPEKLRWLILTHNQVSVLPEALGHRPRLQKLMLAGNRLTALPESLAGGERLELLRIAANRFETLPRWLIELPRLAWLGCSGNSFSRAPASASLSRDGARIVSWQALRLEQKLGEGASGVIHRASLTCHGKESSVAVKIFKGAVTSDGLPQDEMDACIAAGLHDHLIGATGHVVDHPEGRQGLLMPLVDSAFRVLAGPPSLDSCTRDVYADDVRFTPKATLGLMQGVASAAAHLHHAGVLHGDLYAHNILWRTSGAALLGDFGAASFLGGLGDDIATGLQRLETRAFGCLLEECLNRMDGDASAPLVSALERIRDDCMQPTPRQRPLFSEIVGALADASRAVVC